MVRRSFLKLLEQRQLVMEQDQQGARHRLLHSFGKGGKSGRRVLSFEDEQPTQNSGRELMLRSGQGLMAVGAPITNYPPRIENLSLSASIPAFKWEENQNVSHQTLQWTHGDKQLGSCPQKPVSSREMDSELNTLRVTLYWVLYGREMNNILW